ncbi:MAG TPA: alpha-hydroxy acid oxidase, partial [Bryobacteraceae bacterium]
SFITLSDFEAAAREKLPPMIWDYFSGGAQDEITLRENRAAYDRIPLHYRVMRGVANRDLTATVLGQAVSFPVLAAPMAFQGLAHDDAETAMARAAGKFETVMVLSMLATTAVEDVVEATTAPIWMQLYLQKDRAAVRDLVKRAEQAGCKALVLTVDSPVFGRQERNLRNRFELPRNLLVRNLLPRRLERLPRSWSNINQHSFEDHLDPSLTWRDVAWLCSITRLPVLVKGVIRPDDAVLAVEHGAKGVIISNHGGRQLDTSPATISVLANIAAAVGERCDVLVDGGVRRGTDVIKAIALGAKAVLVGRPLLWGLASNGEAGVATTLEILRTEFDSALALCGCRSVAEISPDLIHGPVFGRDTKALQTAASSGE